VGAAVLCARRPAPPPPAPPHTHMHTAAQAGAPHFSSGTSGVHLPRLQVARPPCRAPCPATHYRGVPALLPCCLACRASIHAALQRQRLWDSWAGCHDQAMRLGAASCSLNLDGHPPASGAHRRHWKQQQQWWWQACRASSSGGSHANDCMQACSAALVQTSTRLLHKSRFVRTVW
jgi:hypothetical protein